MDVIEMRAEASQTQVAAPNIGISYRQIAAVRLLQLPSQNLDEVLHHEIESNPALDADTRQCCPRCNSPLESPSAPCPNCDGGSRAAKEERPRESMIDAEGPIYSSTSYGEDEYDDPITRVAAIAPTGEALLQTLCLSIPDEDAFIAEYLVGNLDHHGFLPPDIVDVAVQEVGSDRESVERTLAVLQRLDPPGIGARGGQECLLIQLQRLRDAGDPHPVAEVIVRDRFRELANRRYREIARSLGITPRRVEAEWEFIRNNLHPYPAHGFEGGAQALAAAAAPVRPDVVMRKTAQGYMAEVVERNRYVLRVDAEYLWARKNLSHLGCDDATRQHIRKHVDQAQAFIAALRQRWDTMQRVSDALIEMQREFLEYGQSALKPLTRADVARKIGLHESTVSRATDGKYVLLPNGKTASFDDFFDASLPAKKALIDIIASENTERPYSDEQLMRILSRKGIIIARRTIAKYREELGILPSRMRRVRASATALAAQTSQTAPATEPVPALAL